MLIANAAGGSRPMTQTVLILGASGKIGRHSQEAFRQAGWSGLRGYVILGEEDESIRSNNIRQWVEMLNTGGIPTELEEVAHAGHDFAPEYESSLLRGLEFLQQG